MPFKCRSPGFTLMEVLITISVVSILAAIAVPSFKYVTTSYRMSAEVNALLGDMQFARSEAQKQGQTVTICASTNGTSCVGSGNTWNTGWIVFLDSNANQTVNANEPIIRTQPAFTGTDTFVASVATFWYATYYPGGYSPTGLAATITLKLHDSTSNSMYTRCLQFTQMGTPTTEKFGNGTGNGSPACT
ncbi:MAG: GspH/FimT family pseudopilin [Steroidobacteraceae bacterium]